jgi:hypothetical protein
LHADLGVTCSHSLLGVSNRKPCSGLQFETLSFASVFPERFGSIGDAPALMAKVVEGYLDTHLLTGIGLNTSADSHFGLDPGRGPGSENRPLHQKS